MSNLNLATVELVSTLRAAPLNGSPSSQDYNDSWTEALADLASIAGFIDEIIIPMMDGLIGTILPNPNGSPLGLEGRFIYSDTTDSTSVFFNNLSDQSLSIADSLRVIQGIVTTTQQAIAILNVEVIALQTQLSTTNQNDIAQALQNFAASLQSLTSQTQSLQSSVATYETNGTSNTLQNTLNLQSGNGITVSNPSGGDVLIAGATLQTNGTNNSTQTLLNLAAGPNVSVSESGGTVTISAVGGGSGGTIGGVSIKTGSYGLAAGDSGFLIILNSASAETFTLPSPPPSSTWFVILKNESSGVLTVSRNSLTIDGRNTNLMLEQGDSVLVFTDGTNYETGAPRPFDVAVFSPSIGSNNQKLVRFNMVRTVIFPVSALNSQATASTAATGSTTYTFSKNGSSFATVNFAVSSTAGIYTQASDALFSPGDLLEIDGPATADTTLADVGLTLSGFRF